MIGSMYSIHPGILMEEKIALNMESQTGKSLDQWFQIVRSSSSQNERDQVVWLKTQFGVSTLYASCIVERLAGRGGIANYQPERFVADMFSGAKVGLLPLYEKLLAFCLSLGEDVAACPAKTIVPVYRNHVFAQIKPTTSTRIDLGLAVKNAAGADELMATGGLQKGDRITHRIPIHSIAEIDAHVKQWLKKAYDLDA